MSSNVSLFANQRDANRRSCATMIERCLAELGHDVAASRAGDHQWKIQHGSATVRVALIDRDDYVHLRIVAPVMLTDARVDTGKLYRKLLRLNATDVFGAAFAVEQNAVQLVAERSTLDLDTSEIRDLVRRVCAYADAWDDQLVDEFGGRVGGLD